MAPIPDTPQKPQSHPVIREDQDPTGEAEKDTLRLGNIPYSDWNKIKCKCFVLIVTSLMLMICLLLFSYPRDSQCSGQMTSLAASTVERAEPASQAPARPQCSPLIIVGG
ncbi:hypothetical protein L3Q82_002988 [Scortum barcoo]|uniref:Uncharacterized protein n=1 Tax=Scortum barcoo TaxID=214431 RepID=A0ACB8VS05_9TELE|nr:hypothetical protein L3Q82_002988 [Scortum barcoo]